MTLEQANKELQKVEDEILAKRANDLKLEQEGCKDYYKYSFLNHVEAKKLYLSDEAEKGLENLIDNLNNYKDFVYEKYKNKLNFKIKFETPDSENDTYYISGNYFCATYKELKSDEEIERIIQEEKRTRLEELLKPEDKEIWRRSVDCKLARLFFDGVIDFTALQKLVYSDCNI